MPRPGARASARLGARHSDDVETLWRIHIVPKAGAPVSGAPFDFSTLPVETTIRTVPRIALEGVTKSFAAAGGKSVAAVAALSLEIHDGEMLAMVGPSGCGKTTTLRLIAGLESADNGRILFDAQPVTALPPVERDVAMVFQSPALFPHFTAFDNIALGLKLRHVSQSEIYSRVREVAELLAIRHCLDRKPGHLSGGEQQRVALGRALARRPKILLLDEPLSHLDEPLRAQLRSELRAIHSSLNLTVIYVTHDQAEAMALGDRVVILRNGTLQQVGPPREIYRTPANAFVAGFVGSPPMNLIRGMVTPTGCDLALNDDNQASKPSRQPTVLRLGNWRQDWLSQNNGRPVLLGIRPEHIRFVTGETPAGEEHAVQVLVESLQYSGHETVVRLALGSQVVSARTKANVALQPGETVAMAFDLSHACLYDARGGELMLQAEAASPMPA